MAMDTDRFVAQAQAAAEDLRARGSTPLPLAEAFSLDPATERLLQALVGLQILAPDEIPALVATG